MMPHRTATAPACETSSVDFHSERAAVIAEAKAICAGCDLREACLRTALSFPDEDQWGVWGGLTGDARRKLRREHPDRYPVTALQFADYLGTRGERWGARYGEHEGPVRPPVDWAQVDRDELDERVVSLMDRYADVTESGYGLTVESGSVHHVNNEVAA